MQLPFPLSLCLQEKKMRVITSSVMAAPIGFIKSAANHWRHIETSQVSWCCWSIVARFGIMLVVKDHKLEVVTYSWRYTVWVIFENCHHHEILVDLLYDMYIALPPLSWCQRILTLLQKNILHARRNLPKDVKKETPWQDTYNFQNVWFVVLSCSI